MKTTIGFKNHFYNAVFLKSYTLSEKIYRNQKNLYLPVNHALFRRADNKIWILQISGAISILL